MAGANGLPSTSTPLATWVVAGPYYHTTTHAVADQHGSGILASSSAAQMISICLSDGRSRSCNCGLSLSHSGAKCPYPLARGIDAGMTIFRTTSCPSAVPSICNKGCGPVARRLADVDCAAAFMYVPGQVDQPEVACLTQQFGRPADFLGNLQWCESNRPPVGYHDPTKKHEQSAHGRLSDQRSGLKRWGRPKSLENRQRPKAGPVTIPHPRPRQGLPDAPSQSRGATEPGSATTAARTMQFIVLEQGFGVLR